MFSKGSAWSLSLVLLSGGVARDAVAQNAVPNEKAESSAAESGTAKSGAAKTSKAASSTKTATKTAATKTATKRVRGTAYVRVIHAIPDAAAADVYLDTQKVLTGATFKAVSDYIPVNSGKHAAKVTVSGQSDALLTGSVSLTKDKYYTVAAYGSRETPKLLLINESTGKTAEGKARVYVANLAGGVPSIDTTTPSTRSKARDHASFIKGVMYGTARAKTVTAGVVNVQARSAEKVVKEQGNMQAEAGKRYTVFAVGNVGTTGNQAFDLIAKPAAVK